MILNDSESIFTLFPQLFSSIYLVFLSRALYLCTVELMCIHSSSEIFASLSADLLLLHAADISDVRAQICSAYALRFLSLDQPLCCQQHVFISLSPLREREREMSARSSHCLVSL